MAKETMRMSWNKVVQSLSLLGNGTTRYGDPYPIYRWDKDNKIFIEWWYSHNSSERRAVGVIAGMTPYGFGVRDVGNTSRPAKTAKTAAKTAKTAKTAAKTAKTAEWMELFEKQSAILSSLIDRMAKIESALAL